MVVHEMSELQDTQPFAALTKRTFDAPSSFRSSYPERGKLAIEIKSILGEDDRDFNCPLGWQTVLDGEKSYRK